jgi:hypothetical protein
VLGNLAAAFSATSQHTIHPEMSRSKLRELALRSKQEIEPLSSLLKPSS